MKGRGVDSNHTAPEPPTPRPSLRAPLERLLFTISRALKMLQYSMPPSDPSSGCSLRHRSSSAQTQVLAKVDDSADFHLCFCDARRRSGEGRHLRVLKASVAPRTHGTHEGPPYTTTHYALTALRARPLSCVFVRAQMPTDPFPLFPSVRMPCHAARSAARCESPAPQCQRRTRCTRMLRFRPSTAIF